MRIVESLGAERSVERSFLGMLQNLAAIQKVKSSVYKTVFPLEALKEHYQGRGNKKKATQLISDARN